MHRTCCRTVLCTAILMLGTGVPASAEAGLIPWMYNAVFGPSYAYYGYGAPMYGAAYPGTRVMSSYYSPGWATYTAGYGPAFSYDAYGSGLAGCGCSSPCAACGCANGNCSSGNCASGNCAGGNCGAGYAPDINNGPTPEPTQANPPRNPPVANPPTIPSTSPPIDDFTRVPPRTNDSTIPNTNPMTNPSVPSTIPNRTAPNAVPDTNNTPSAPPYNNGGANGLFEQPMLERKPAPVEPAIPDRPAPGTNEVLPLGTGIFPAPLEVGSAPMASLKVNRQRIETHAGYRPVAVDRMAVSPRVSPAERLAHK